MSRMQRIVIPDQPLLILQRGNNGSETFFADDDYLFYLHCLQIASTQYNCAIHAYVLMPNHVHLLVTPSDVQGVSRFMQSVGRRYVRYFNSKYDRTGTLWEGRYKSSLIDTENYLLTCCRYIEMNPVRAGIVNHPNQYPWSSYKNNAELVASELISPHQLYLDLGRTQQERGDIYRALFHSNIDDVVLDNIRVPTNKDGIIGSMDFVEEIQSLLNRCVTKGQHGGDRRSKCFKVLCASRTLAS